MSDSVKDGGLPSREAVVTAARKTVGPRLPYQTPCVRRLGTVEDLTSAVTGAGADGGTASMAGG